MIDRQKSESPAATGLHAEQTKTDSSAILIPQGSAVNPTGHALDQGEFRQLRSRFARRGYALQRVYRAHDGRTTFHVMRGARCRVLSHPHDLRAYLAVIEEAPV